MSAGENYTCSAYIRGIFHSQAWNADTLYEWALRECGSSFRGRPLIECGEPQKNRAGKIRVGVVKSEKTAEYLIKH